MHDFNSYTETGSTSRDAAPFVGFEAGYGTDLFRWGDVRLGWELGAGLTPVRVTDDESFSSSVNVSAFVYKTGGIVMPPAGYQGESRAGLTSPPSPRATQRRHSVSPATVTGTRRLDVMLYTLRLGPTLTWDLGDRFGDPCWGGTAVGVVTGDYKYNETVLTATGSALNSGSMSMTKTVYGGYVDAMALYHAISHGDVYLGARFMPFSSASVSGGGRSASRI